MGQIEICSNNYLVKHRFNLVFQTRNMPHHEFYRTIIYHNHNNIIGSIDFHKHIKKDLEEILLWLINHIQFICTDLGYLAHNYQVKK